MVAGRNALSLVIAVLVVGIIGFGWALYEEKKQPEGLEISVGRNGLSIKEK